MKTTLNTIAPKSTLMTASEAAGHNTIWDNLISLVKFAGCSKPEREDAIQQIRYTLDNYEVGPWQKDVLERIIAILELD